MKKVFTLLMILGLAGGCADHDKKKTPTKGEQAKASQSQSATMLSGAASLPQKATYDQEILNAIVTVNTQEMNLARLAREKANNPVVRNFADSMYREHALSNDRMSSFRVQQNLQFEETAQSMKVKSKGENTLEELRQKSGQEFDRAYMNAQVNIHREALQAIESDFLPVTKNAHLRSMLQRTKEDVQHHLREANKIRTTI